MSNTDVDTSASDEARRRYPDWLTSTLKTAPNAPPLPPQAATPISQTPPGSPKQQLSPQSTGISEAPPPPPDPKLKDVPASPHVPMEDPLEVFNIFKNPAIILAGMGSLFSRQALTTAFNSASGAVKGFREGQKDVAAQKMAEWKAATEQAMEHNKVELQKYNVALNKRDMNIKDKFAALYAQSSASDDPVMSAAIRSGNIELVEKIVTARESAQLRLNTMVAGEKAKAEIRQKNGPALSDDTIEFLARQGIAGNKSMLTGWYRFPQIRLQIEEKMRELLQDQGHTGQQAADQVAKNTAAVTALNQGAGVLGRREALVTAAIQTAQQSGTRVLEALSGVERTKYSDLNKIIRAGEIRTGSAEEIRLGIAVNTFINNYARASSSISGVTTDTARGEAHELLEAYWSKGQIEAGIDQMLNRELPSELLGAQQGMETFVGGYKTPGAEGGGTPAAGGNGGWSVKPVE
jgi:hypothetical protein